MSDALTSPLVRALVEQLLDPDVVRVLELFGDEQVDVRLSVSRGKVRARPTITVNGGPQPHLDI